MLYVFLVFASVNVLLRAQIETFLMFDFIYIQSESPDEIEFRYTNWIYAGLLNLQRFTPTQDATIEQANKDNDERARLRLVLERSPIMERLYKDKKKGILENGKPRLDHQWWKLLESAGIGKELGKNLYSRLSSNAHSEGMAMRNLEGTHFKYHKNHLAGFTVLFTSKLYLSLFLKKLIEYR